MQIYINKDIVNLYWYFCSVARWLKNEFQVGKTRKRGWTLGTPLDPKAQKPPSLQPQRSSPPTKPLHQSARGIPKARPNNPPNPNTSQAPPPNANTGSWRWISTAPKCRTEARRSSASSSCHSFLVLWSIFLNIVIMQLWRETRWRTSVLKI